jgi:hypothetical protein
MTSFVRWITALWLNYRKVDSLDERKRAESEYLG